MKISGRLNLLIWFFLFLAFISVEINAQTAGSLDTSFGTNGVVATNLRNTAALYDIAIQPDRKILVGGSTFENMIVVTVGVVARFNEDGSLDTTFDGDGFNNSGFIKTVYALKLLPDGKILVGGFSIDNHFSIARLNSDGSLDTTFDGDGVVKTTIGINSQIKALEVLPDGKIIAVGWCALSTNANRDIAMVKYNADGSLDTSFGSGGRVATELGSNEYGYDVATQADGKIVVVGEHLDSLSGQLMGTIIRYNANGSMDSQFGDSGKIYNSSSSFSSARKVVIQPDGKIIVAGEGMPPTRYNTDGTLDIVFGTTQGASSFSLSRQPDGKIIVSGSNDFISYSLARYNSNGTLDTSFGTGGTSPLTIGVNDSALTPDGKIVVGGNLNQFRMARYFTETPSRAFADFDGDGRTDIAIYRPSVGEWWIKRSFSAQTSAAQFGASTDKPVPADFTGDGKADVAFFRPSTGEWFVLRSEDSSFFSFNFGAVGDISAVGDFDGDGKADPTVFRPSTGEWFILKSSGGTAITTFGTSGDVPVTADYDGDSKTDVAIFRPSDGSWWYVRSSDGQFRVYRFGVGTDKPVQGDYTGDGKADIAVFRPSTGEWFVQRSEDNSFYSVPFGASGDIPAPGDYDGDGKFDTAVFRPNGATWYVNRSTTGILITNFGASGDRPIPNVFVP